MFLSEDPTHPLNNCTKQGRRVHWVMTNIAAPLYSLLSNYTVSSLAHCLLWSASQFWSTYDDLVLLHQSFKSFQWPPCCLQASGALYSQVLSSLLSPVSVIRFPPQFLFTHVNFFFLVSICLASEKNVGLENEMASLNFIFFLP